MTNRVTLTPALGAVRLIANENKLFIKQSLGQEIIDTVFRNEMHF